jgi:hypothetical protein
MATFSFQLSKYMHSTYAYEYSCRKIQMLSLLFCVSSTIFSKEYQTQQIHKSGFLSAHADHHAKESVPVEGYKK